MYYKSAQRTRKIIYIIFIIKSLSEQRYMISCSIDFL